MGKALQAEPADRKPAGAVYHNQRPCYGNQDAVEREAGIMEDLFFVLTLPIAIPMNYIIRGNMDFFSKFPYKPRMIHWIIATWGGLFWLPCTLCGKYRGGHEKGGYLSTSYGQGVGVCNDCVKKANRRNKESNYHIPKFIKIK